MIIEFGDWRLIPCDQGNWELAHRHAAKRGKNAGRVQWNRIGRFYQHNTIANAIEYAIDCDMRDGADVTTLEEPLGRYRAMLAEFEESVRASLRAYASLG